MGRKIELKNKQELADIENIKNMIGSDKIEDYYIYLIKKWNKLSDYIKDPNEEENEYKQCYNFFLDTLQNLQSMINITEQNYNIEIYKLNQELKKIKIIPNFTEEDIINKIKKLSDEEIYKLNQELEKIKIVPNFTEKDIINEIKKLSDKCYSNKDISEKLKIDENIIRKYKIKNDL